MEKLGIKGVETFGVENSQKIAQQSSVTLNPC